MDIDAPSAGGPAPRGLLDRLMGVSAALGGVLAVGVAVLVVVSVLGRWLLYKPVPGDFELVRIATALTVFAYLPYTQARRANIMVDTFTQRLQQRVRDAIDAFCDRHHLELIGRLPWSDAVLDADAARTPLLDHAPDDPVVAAIADTVEAIVGGIDVPDELEVAG